jgi:hypothetical protein
MMQPVWLFFETLKNRNEPLFYFGLLCLVTAAICLLLTKWTQTAVMGVNAWYKPFKFALSTVLFAWAMAWYLYYLGPIPGLQLYNWTVIVLLGFEIAYIGLQASRGQLSHYNISTPVYAVLYNAMAIAATIVALWTGYIGLLFFQKDLLDLPDYYVWSIRIGIILFVIFALQGFVMGGRMSHTIGAPDGSQGLPILNWSKKFGDARIAHFIGMHALQVLPVLSFYVLKNMWLTLMAGFMYTLLAVFTLVQALQGKPLFKG